MINKSLLDKHSVTVIIPAYRVSKTICESLESVFYQTVQNFEILVINDASPDTPALEEALEIFRSRIRYLKHDRNRGPAATRNTGIEAARSEYIAFLDGDDVWEPNYLEVQMGALQADPAADVVYPDGVCFGDPETEGLRLSARSPSDGPVTLTSLFRQKTMPMYSALVKKHILYQAGLFDTNLRRSEDFDLWVRISKVGKIIYHRELLFRYRKHAGTLSTDHDGMLAAVIAVAEKTFAREDLTSEERNTIQDSIRRWTAERQKVQAKKLFTSGKNREASRLLSLANRYFKNPKLTLAILMMRWTPGMVQRAERDLANLRRRRIPAAPTPA